MMPRTQCLALFALALAAGSASATERVFNVQDPTPFVLTSHSITARDSAGRRLIVHIEAPGGALSRIRLRGCGVQTEISGRELGLLHGVVVRQVTVSGYLPDCRTSPPSLLISASAGSADEQILFRVTAPRDRTEMWDVRSLGRLRLTALE